MLASERWKRKLESPDSVVREKFAEALGNYSFDDASRSLFCLLRDGNSFVRSASLKSLGKIGDKRGFSEALLRLKDNDEIVRIDAIECLGDLDAKKASKYLIRYLDDKNELIRKYAAIIIGESGDNKAKYWLEKRLKNERSGLAKTGLLYGLFLLGQQERLADIIQLLNSKRYQVRCYVVNTLAAVINSTNRDEILSILSQANDNEPTIAVRSSIKTALRKARSMIRNTIPSRTL